MIKRHELTNEEWSAIKELLPPEITSKKGRPAKDNRNMLNGMGEPVGDELLDAIELIIRAAQSILKPMGLFQKGTSRIWIDDNGWFLILVEFQPSSWSQGAYLNVMISFLWSQGRGFSESLSYNIGGRELEYQSRGKTLTRDWVVERIQLAEELLSNIAKKQYVISTITEKRQRLHVKSSYKRLPVTPVIYTTMEDAQTELQKEGCHHGTEASRNDGTRGD